MKRIFDQKIVEHYIQVAQLQNRFDTPNLPFILFQYEKHELIASPVARLKYLLFVVEGTIDVFGIRHDGGFFPVNSVSEGMILGNFEFFSENNTPFYVEAKTDTLCLALSIPENKAVLDQDVQFLHTLIQSFFVTYRLLADIDLPAQSLEERVLLYLKNIAPEHRLDSISSGVMQLRCSRRQLQRVVKKLCEEGRLVKIGKGKYKLSQ